MHSISRRVFISLAITTVVTSLCAYGWIYWEAKLTENVLRQRALLDQANLVAAYLRLDDSGAPVLELPIQLSEAYKSSTGYHRYAVRDHVAFSGAVAVPAGVRHQHRKTINPSC